MHKTQKIRLAIQATILALAAIVIYFGGSILLVFLKAKDYWAIPMIVVAGIPTGLGVYVATQVLFRFSDKSLRRSLVFTMVVLYFVLGGFLTDGRYWYNLSVVTVVPLLMCLYYWSVPRLTRLAGLEDLRTPEEKRKGWSLALWLYAFYFFISVPHPPLPEQTPLPNSFMLMENLLFFGALIVAIAIYKIGMRIYDRRHGESIAA